MNMKKILQCSAFLLAAVPFAAHADISIHSLEAAAGRATITMASDREMKGWLTVLHGTDKNCGYVPNVAGGYDAQWRPAYRFGSIPLQPGTSVSYTVFNMKHDSDYTFCVTDGTNIARQSFTTASMTEFSSPLWEQAGDIVSINDSPYPAPITFAPDGTPYAATTVGIYPNTNAIINVFKYGQNAWIKVGHDSDFPRNTRFAGRSNHPSLVFSPDGTPYIAYVDGKWPDDGHVVIVKKFDGEHWIPVGEPLESSNNDYNSAIAATLAIDQDGVPYLAYQNSMDRATVNVMKFDGNAWQPVGRNRFEGSDRDALFLLKADGVPYLAVSNSASLTTTVFRFNGFDWVRVGNEISTGSPQELLFSPDDALYLVHENLRIMKYTGASWEQAAFRRFNYLTEADMAFAPDGSFYFVGRYKDNPSRFIGAVNKFDGADWITVGDTDFSEDTMRFPKLSFSPDGAPYVIYQEILPGDDNWKTIVKRLQEQPPQP